MTLFVDMDEVIADTYQGHIDCYHKDYGIKRSKEECEGKDFWQCVPEEHQKSIKEHAWQEGFYKNLKVIPHSQQVLEELCGKHEVFIASAAMQFPNSLREKSDWLDVFFPFIPWQNRILCGKKHMLKGDLLIDDRSYHLSRFDGDTILFSSPHNMKTEGFDRANSWLEIADRLL